MCWKIYYSPRGCREPITMLAIMFQGRHNVWVGTCAGFTVQALNTQALSIHRWTFEIYGLSYICVNIWKCIDVIEFTGETYLHTWCQVIIGLGNGLESVRCQTAVSTNAALVPMGPREKSSETIDLTFEAETKWPPLPDDIFKRISVNDHVQISTNISLNFVPYGPVHYDPAFVQIMAWHRPDDEPFLSQWWLDVSWRFQNSSTILSISVHSQCAGIWHEIACQNLVQNVI